MRAGPRAPAPDPTPRGAAPLAMGCSHQGLVSGGLAVSLPGDRPGMLRGLSLRRGPRCPDRRRGIWRPRRVVGDDLADARRGAGRSSRSCCRRRPAPAASSTAPGPRAKTGSACRSLPINARAFLLSTSPRSASGLGDALHRQEYFGAFVSAPGSVFDAEVLAHMFGDDIEENGSRHSTL